MKVQNVRNCLNFFRKKTYKNFKDINLNSFYTKKINTHSNIYVYTLNLG